MVEKRKAGKRESGGGFFNRRESPVRAPGLQCLRGTILAAFCRGAATGARKQLGRQCRNNLPPIFGWDVAPSQGGEDVGAVFPGLLPGL